jgi:hypothetical protein
MFSQQQKERQVRQTNLELGKPTGRLSKAQRQIAKKKEIAQLKSKIGELQRSDLGVRVSDIETNFYKQALQGFESKVAETYQKKFEARTKLEQVNQAFQDALQQQQQSTTSFSLWRTDPNLRLSEAEKTAMSSPKAIVDLFNQKNEMQKKGYRSAARWMKRNWNNEDSYLYKAYVQANEILKQQEMGTSYNQQIENTQRSLDLATQTAIEQAQITAAPLDVIRNQTIDTLGREIKERETTPSTSILTEAKEGPAKTETTTPKVKQKLKRVQQPSYYEGRPQ